MVILLAFEFAIVRISAQWIGATCLTMANRASYITKILVLDSPLAFNYTMVQLYAISGSLVPASLTKSDEEGFEDFAKALINAAKPPVYNATEDIDGTLESLNAHSVPEWQTGLFVGIGLVPPICATLDISTRKLRRAGKLMLRKIGLEKEALALEAGAKRADPGSYERVVYDVSAHNEVSAHLDIGKSNESAATPEIPDELLDRVMRPVSFSRNESKKAQHV